MLLKRMMTTRNVGTLDRILRALPALLVAVLWATGTLSGVLAAVLAIGAGMLLITSLTGACSIYYLLGWSTCPVSQKPRS
ncbi:MAG: DUF2892 domain-containing protein [Pseudomonadota bacterium]